MTSTSTTSTRQPRSTRPAPIPRQATVAGLLGVLGAVMLAGGTGFAYAASTDVETGYLTVVDERVSSIGIADSDCTSS